MGDRRKNLNGLLHYGYFIGAPYEAPALPFSQAALEAARDNRRTLATLDENALCTHGIRLWKTVCRRVIDSRPGPFLLPLSAGLDSRAVLAGMVDQDAPGLRTVTYGVPGSFDYDLAPDIAACAGAPNERIDLGAITVDMDRIDAIARDSGRVSFLMDMYFNRLISDRYGPQYTYLSGYLGDVLAGKRASTPFATWEDARRAFARNNRHSRSVVLTHPEADPVDCLPEAPFVSHDLLSYDDQLEYGVREECAVRPIVLRDEYDCVAPALDEEWVAFLLALGDEQRRDRRLFVRMFQRGFPELFSLPTSARGGLPLTASDRAVRSYKRRLKRSRRLRARLSRLLPRLGVPLADRIWKYIDFEQGLRQRPDLAALLERSVEHLDRRRLVPWIDAAALLHAHVNGVENHGRALNVLLNLDVLARVRPDTIS